MDGRWQDDVGAADRSSGHRLPPSPFGGPLAGTWPAQHRPKHLQAAMETAARRGFGRGARLTWQCCTKRSTSAATQAAPGNTVSYCRNGKLGVMTIDRSSRRRLTMLESRSADLFA